MTPENLHFCVARNGFRRRTARESYFRTLVRHEVLVDGGHLRVSRRGILCHRLVRQNERNKQCEALDCDYLLFQHNFPFGCWRDVQFFSGAGMKKISRTSIGKRHALAPLRAHAITSSMSAHSSIHKPPTCSLVSRYGPSVTSNSPLGCGRSVR